jgi:hypothetical protein
MCLDQRFLGGAMSWNFLRVKPSALFDHLAAVPDHTAPGERR